MINSPKSLPATALDWWNGGDRVALAIVVSTWGSSPSPAGSMMAIKESGDFVGSVSGGCVETEIIAEAQALIATRRTKLLNFGVANARAWQVGLACGGRLEVFLSPIVDDNELKVGMNVATLGQLVADQAINRPVVLATNLKDGRSSIIYPDGKALPKPMEKIRLLAQEALRTDTPKKNPIADSDLFVVPFNPPLRLIIVGAVHIAQALARIATLTGYQVILIDPRSAFATHERFPDLEISRDWPDEAITKLAPDHRTAVVALTHDPKLDDAALKSALDSSAFYIGALGSAKNQNARIARLKRSGVSDELIRRIHGPVGLPIGSKKPEEIALSIMAEMTAVLRQSDLVADVSSVR